MSPLKPRSGELFGRGSPPWLRSGAYALLAILCLMSDYQAHRLETLRQMLHIWSLPFEEVATLPSWSSQTIAQHFTTLNQLQAQNDVLQRQLLQQTTAIQKNHILARELAQLHALIGITPPPLLPSRISRVIGTSQNPYIQKLLIEGGESQNILRGSPVTTDQGLVGQITEVYPNQSEVTLISNRDLTIPVEIERTGLHTLATGTGYQGELTLPYIPNGADIQVGDVLLTSGIDGLYPRGLRVASVSSITHHRSTAFEDIQCRINLGVDTYSLVLVTPPASPTSRDNTSTPITN